MCVCVCARVIVDVGAEVAGCACGCERGPQGTKRVRMSACLQGWSVAVHVGASVTTRGNAPGGTGGCARCVHLRESG